MSCVTQYTLRRRCSSCGMAGRQLRPRFVGLRHQTSYLLVLRSRWPARTTPTPATAAPVLRRRRGGGAAEQRLDRSAHFLLHQVTDHGEQALLSRHRAILSGGRYTNGPIASKGNEAGEPASGEACWRFLRSPRIRRGRPGARTRRRVVPAAGRTWRDARAPPHTCALARRACVVLAFASSSSPAPPVPERCVGTLPRQRMTATGRDCHVAARFSPHRPMPSAAMPLRVAARADAPSAAGTWHHSSLGLQQRARFHVRRPGTGVDGIRAQPRPRAGRSVSVRRQDGVRRLASSASDGKIHLLFEPRDGGTSFQLTRGVRTCDLLVTGTER